MDFISMYDAMPALNSLVEYKDKFEDTGHTRLIMSTEKEPIKPFLFWAGLNGDSTKWPSQLLYWKYVEEDQELREKEASDWVSTLPTHVTQS